MKNLISFDKYKKDVGLNVERMFTGKVSDVYGRTRASSSKHRTATNKVVIHTTGNNASARNEALNLKNNEGGGQSFHAVADEHGVYETVRFADVAHHAGDKSVNVSSLGFEMVDYNQDKAYPNFIKYVAYAMATVGVVPSRETVLFHNEIVSTSCGSYLRNLGKDRIVKDLKYYFNIAVGGNSEVVKPQPKPKPQPSLKFNVGDNVNVNGVVHYNSAGDKPGIKVTGKHKITAVSNGKFPYHIGSLGWVSSSSISQVEAPKPKPKPQPSLNIVKERGRFTPNRTLDIMNSYSSKSGVWGKQYSGDSFIYDSYVVSEGKVWVRGERSGKWVAWRVNGGEKFGHCEFI